MSPYTIYQLRSQQHMPLCHCLSFGETLGDAIARLNREPFLPSIDPSAGPVFVITESDQVVLLTYGENGWWEIGGN